MSRSFFVNAWCFDSLFCAIFLPLFYGRSFVVCSGHFSIVYLQIIYQSFFISFLLLFWAQLSAAAPRFIFFKKNKEKRSFSSSLFSLFYSSSLLLFFSLLLFSPRPPSQHASWPRRYNVRNTGVKRQAGRAGGEEKEKRRRERKREEANESYEWHKNEKMPNCRLKKEEKKKKKKKKKKKIVRRPSYVVTQNHIIIIHKNGIKYS